MRTRLRLSLTMIALLGLAAPAAAQQADGASEEAAGEDAAAETPAAEPTEEERQQAREAYAQGQELFRAGQFEESLASFERAYELIPNPVVLLGVAEASERTGDVTRTIEALEGYLEGRPDAPDRADVEARLERLRAIPGQIFVSTDPQGATIVLDGEDTGEVTPATLEAGAGDHVVSLTLEGYEPVEGSVSVLPSSRHEVNAEFTPLPPPEPETQEGGLNGEGEPIEEAAAEDGEDESADDEGPGTAVWVTSGIAAATLVGGTVLGFMALSREAEFDDEPSADKADQGENFALFADVLFGVAAVSAITAIVLFLTDDADEDEDDEDATAGLQLTPVMTRQGGGVSARLSF
ncbi:MAG TPA: PEGA domain-containing protein [Polyangiaceae bacterium LLY-WYZ-15_(1-7)]|nr:hypothetical protein [Myxococcales bacterium]MAT26680.1 hypothetical protein [Sandaracinus sp.]HJL02562.1 PEGA domain-containing protein [Polyangiaceae bacterium LLY-WYZ-15_(1-7)]MBJ73623.1 hypothetical protein [Sandaracinus sp.]HJL13126.1 PEGA domain-containing protein [Polyangiaceae bacterium LLY-WYZ-15_(1-7)]